MTDDREDGSSDPARRLFFALCPQPSAQAALAEATRNVVSACGGRPVPPQNFHVTLVFLGSVPGSRVADVMAIAERAVSELQLPVTQQTAMHASSLTANAVFDHPVRLTFDCIDFWKKARVLVATTGVSPGTGHGISDALAGILQRETSSAGFAPHLKPLWSVGRRETQEFRPHVTLARRVARPIHPTGIEPVLWSFTDFALIESRTEPNGSVYTVLQSFPLGVRQGSDP